MTPLLLLHDVQLF